MSLLKQLHTEIEQLRIVDKYRLLAKLKYITKTPTSDQTAKLTTLQKQIEVAKAKLLLRQQALQQLEIEYPDTLPVSQQVTAITKLIKENQVVIIAGETGSGKTTQLPKICLQLGFGVKGTIGHTQPRRVAARAVADRLAEELQVELGNQIGYKFRFHDKSNPQTLVKLMTDGILLTEIQQDKYLSEYEVLIIDEAHERSLNNDFILGYLKQLLNKRRDLKVIITSATINLERFSQHFNNAPILEVSGRTYPVEVLYRPWLAEDNSLDLSQAIIMAVQELKQYGTGDILIFLNGERDIRDLKDALQKANFRHTEILSLYARLSINEQNKIFHPGALQRIILTTNVAETSLTVPRIKYVIDTGTARISRYNVRTKIQHLPIEAISQASANQRKGRCGRISDGICLRLYSEADFLARPEFTDAEILRTNLASVILQMLNLGITKIEDFPFLDAPDTRNIQDGYRLLIELQAIKATKQGYKLTTVGRQLSQFPIDPRFAKILITANKYNCLHEIMRIVSFLSIQDPRERPLDKQQAADEKHQRFQDKQSDFMSILNLWDYLQQQQQELTRNKFSQQCRAEFINYLRIREWQDVYQQLRLIVRSQGLNINTSIATYQELHSALLSGLLAHIGSKDLEKNQYTGARNSKFNIHPSSGLSKSQPKWIVAAELVATTKLWARMVAKIEPEWIEPLANHLVNKHYNEPRWSMKRQQVVANEKIVLFGLPIVANRVVNYGNIDPVISREIFIREALVFGNWRVNYPFYKKNTKLIQQVEDLEHKARKRGILVDDQDIYNFYDQKIPVDIVSTQHFDSWWQQAQKRQADLLDMQSEDLMQITHELSAQHYPDFWQYANFKLKLSYQFEPSTQQDGVTVHLPITLLNQIDTAVFSWQIPAFRQELVVALIKSLPKNLRKNFVPAPNYAEAFLQRVEAYKGSILNSLTTELRKMTGVTINHEDFDLSVLPTHLQLNFSIEDEQGNCLQQGKDLTIIKAKLATNIQQAIAKVSQQHVETSQAVTWQFGTIEPKVESKQGNLLINAYPALVDAKHNVILKFFDNPISQQEAMQQGLCRLLILNIESPIKYLQTKLPNKTKLSMYYASFGSVAELINDCIYASVLSLINKFGGVIWQEQQFNQLKDFVRAEINDTMLAVALQVEKILSLYNSLQKQLKKQVNLQQALAFTDMQQQLSFLVNKGFVTRHGVERLADIQRYLDALVKRLEKIAIDSNRDRLHMLKVQQTAEAYKQLLAIPNIRQQITKDELNEISYMLEELRVSFFAQQLGTKYPISEKRILAKITELKQSIT